MEAALLRVPTVASPTEAFKYAIRSGMNGYLATSGAEWAEALDLLVRDAEVRKSIGEAAYAHVLENYHPLRRSAELVATLSQLCESLPGKPFQISPAQPAGQDGGSFRIDPEIERNPTLLRMAVYSLRHRGARTLLVQVWVYIRRLMAPIFPFRRTG
jgi:hypothetical protein